MFEELKKAALKKWRKRAIIFLILGILCFIPTGLFRAIYKDIDSVSREEWTNGSSVIFQVSESSGEIAEEYKNTMDKENSEKYAVSIFLLPEADEAAKTSDTVDAKSAYYAAVTVDGSEKSKMKKLTGLSMDGSKEAKPVTFYGYLREMTPMEMIYTGEHLASKGADQETIDALLLDYNFIVEGSRPHFAYTFAILGLYLILRGFYLLIKANKKTYEDVLFQNTRKAGFAMARISTIGESSSPPTVLGIYAEGRKNPYFVGIGRMKACLDEVFADLQKRNPGIEIGYSRYIEKEFRKNHR